MFWQKSYRLEWYLIIWHYLNLYVYSISFIARHFLLWKLTGVKFNFETMFQQERNLRRRQYDLVIIERTIGIVLGPFTALYRSFLKRCTLTNKKVGTLWRALSILYCITVITEHGQYFSCMSMLGSTKTFCSKISSLKLLLIRSNSLIKGMLLVRWSLIVNKYLGIQCPLHPS